VTTRPVNTDRRKRRIAEGVFVVLGVVMIVLIGSQGVRAAHAKRRSDKKLAVSQAKLDATFQALLKSNADGARSQNLNIRLLQSLLERSEGISQSLQTIVKVVGNSPVGTPKASKIVSFTPHAPTAIDFTTAPFVDPATGGRVDNAYIFTPSVHPSPSASTTWVIWDFGDGGAPLIDYPSRSVYHAYVDGKPQHKVTLLLQ
jgi:hypothetical protein